MSRSFNDQNRRQQRPFNPDRSSSRSRLLWDIDLVEREIELDEDLENEIPIPVRRPARRPARR